MLPLQFKACMFLCFVGELTYFDNIRICVLYVRSMHNELEKTR